MNSGNQQETSIHLNWQHENLSFLVKKNARTMSDNESKVVIFPDMPSAPVDQRMSPQMQGISKQLKPWTTCSPLIVGAITAVMIILTIGLIYLIVYGLKLPWKNN
jgi:hypothetical protein